MGNSPKMITRAHDNIIKKLAALSIWPAPRETSEGYKMPSQGDTMSANGTHYRKSPNLDNIARSVREVRINGGHMEQSNFNDYRCSGSTRCQRSRFIWCRTPQRPAASANPDPGAAPALTNAIFVATGK
jgi:hypothetical protein